MANTVQLSNLRVWSGVRTDGTAEPGAQIFVAVDFDPVGAGCDTGTDSEAGFCDPGAQISWYINNVFSQTEVASGYDQSLGGYTVTSPSIIAPDSGSIIVSVSSENQVSLTIPVAATGEEPGEGSVAVTYVSCGNSPDYGCSCESDGELIIYFTKNTVIQGDGIGYVDVYVDEVLTASNSPTSTTTGGTSEIDSVSISCPSSSVSHTILVQGQNGDPGASIILAANTPEGVGETSTGTSTGLVNTGSVSGALSLTGGTTILPALPSSSKQKAWSSTATGQLIPGIDNTALAIVGGSAVVAAGLLFIMGRALKNSDDL